MLVNEILIRNGKQQKMKRNKRVKILRCTFIIKNTDVKSFYFESMLK